MSIFSERLVEIRKKQNVTQKHLAEILEIGTTRLNYWEKGKREPDIDMIKKISKFLNVDANYLLGIDNSVDCVTLTPHEKEVITAYRGQPDMQTAVDKLLGVSSSEE